MFRFINKLSENENVNNNDQNNFDSPMHLDESEPLVNGNLTEQPMILSAVEATLSSYYKDEGDALLDLLEKQQIRVLFDETLSSDTGAAHYSENDNTLVLSSQPHDILDMAREMHRVLSNLKVS